MKRKPKTSGKPWLGHSLTAFNGMRYADKSGVINFLDSYVAHKRRMGDLNAILLVNEHFLFAKETVGKLLHQEESTNLQREDLEMAVQYYNTIRDE